MKKGKKWLALFLATTMVFSLAGCGGKKDNNNNNSVNSGKVTESTEDTAAPADIWEPYKDAVTLKTVAMVHPGEVYPEGDDVTSNIWTRFFKDKMNVDIDTLWVSDDYETKINLSIAEANVPDVFWVKGPQLQQLEEADMVMDLTDIFEKYASDRLKRYMEEVSSDTFETGKKDGKLYGIPQLDYGIINQPNYVWIRQDWKNELNLPDPKTMDDLVNICKAFKDKYGSFGLATDQELNGLKILAPAWQAYPTLWLEKDNKIVYGGVQPEMKEALATFAQWYKDGILDSEFPISDYDKTNQAVINGKCGVQPFYQWWGYMGKDVIINQGEQATFLPYNIPSATGKEVLSPLPFTNPGYTVISKKCKNPEAVIKLMNCYVYAMSEDSIGELDDETRAAMQKLEFTPNSFMITNPESDYEQFVRVTEALKTKDTSKLVTPGMMAKYNSSIDWMENKNPDAYGDYMQQGDPQCAYSLGKEIIDNHKYLPSKLWGMTPDSLNQMGSTLDDLLLEGYTKIITGEKPIDYFDELVENWKAAGGEQVTNDMQEKYGK